jgi:uncharacterized membrane protein YgaE (UPF0421/DUF939 family)
MDTMHTHALQMAGRAAMAAAIAFWAAEFFGSSYAIYALIAAVMVTNLSVQETRDQAIPRLVGTVTGGVVGALWTYVLPSGPLALGLAVFVAMVPMYLLRLDGGARLAGYMAALVIYTHAGDPWIYAVMRGFETVLGIAAAVLVSYVPKLMRAAAPPDGAAGG